MKKPFLVSIRQLIPAAIICIATTALAQPEQQESRVDAALADLASQDLDKRDMRAAGLKETGSALRAAGEASVTTTTAIVIIRMSGKILSCQF